MTTRVLSGSVGSEDLVAGAVRVPGHFALTHVKGKRAAPATETRVGVQEVGLVNLSEDDDDAVVITAPRPSASVKKARHPHTEARADYVPPPTRTASGENFQTPDAAMDSIRTFLDDQELVMAFEFNGVDVEFTCVPSIMDDKQSCRGLPSLRTHYPAQQGQVHTLTRFISCAFEIRCNS